MEFITVGYSQINTEIFNSESLHSFSFLPGEHAVTFQLEIVADNGVVQKLAYLIHTPEQLIHVLQQLIDDDVIEEYMLFGGWSVSDFYNAYNEMDDRQIRYNGKRFWNLLINSPSNPLNTGEF